MITTFYPPYSFGGDAVFVQRLSRALARRGHEVDVIHCQDAYRSLAGGEPATDYVHEPGVTVHGLRSRFGILSPLATQQTGWPLFKARRIKEILAEKQFDVIHFHNISLVGGPGVLRYGRAVKLYTLHEYWLICPAHMLFKFKREPCEKKACLRCQLVYRRPPQWWRYTNLLKKAVRHVDAFIAPVEFARQRHAAAGLDLPTVILPHAFGSDETPAPVELPTRPFFLFVGRLEKLKGVQTLLAAFQKFRGADLVIAGDGEYAADLKSQATGCDHVHFLGRLTAGQLRTAYQRCIAVVMPSTSYEVFPMVMLEAFAAHTPVIVRDLGPLPVLVAESGGGLVFRDEAGLLTALRRLHTEPALRESLADAGQAMWRERWSEDAHLQSYFELIACKRR